MATPEELVAKIDRRKFLRIGGITLAGLATLGLSCATDRSQSPNPTTTPTKKPTITPTVVPTTELLDTRIVENLQKELLNLDNYSPNLREKFLNYWLQGSTPTVEYSKNGRSYLLVFEPAKADPNLHDLAVTRIRVLRTNLSTGGSALGMFLTGTYNPSVVTDAPSQLQPQLGRMNSEHEAIISLAAVNGNISAGQDLGLNFKFPSETGLQENKQLTELNKYKPVIEYNAEAVAEINDYLLTYPILEKNSQGDPLFARHPSSEKPLPVVGGKIFLEAGLTFIVDQTIGKLLRGINNFDQLAQKYPTLNSIPGSEEYLRQIEQHFRDNP